MSSATILLIEDNPLTRKMVRVALEAEGYAVEEAGDAHTALERLAQRPADLVLHGLVLPDMDGFDLIQKLRELPGWLDVPILAYSGMLSKLEQARSLELGFTDFLFKPVEPSRLVETVRKYLPPAVVSHTAAGRRLLVVNDDAVQLKLWKTYLQQMGFQVTTATDGSAALEEARRSPPDAIVSDVLMPHLDGFGLTQSIRAETALERIPVVLISAAYVEEKDHLIADASGASAFLAGVPGCQEIGDALLDALRKTAPVPPSPPVELTEEHTYRIIRQLEHQAALNAGMTQRLAMREAELAVLTGVTETLRNTAAVEDVLDVLLYRCTDAAGVSQGAVYLLDPNGRLVLRAHHGYSLDDLPVLAEFFGHADLLDRVIESGQVEEVAGPRDLLDQAGARALLIAPLAAGQERFGALVMASSWRTLGEDWLPFAQAVGGQIAQGIRLARVLSLLRQNEEKLARIVDTMADGLLLSDQSGNFTFANAAAERILGLPAARIIESGWHDPAWTCTTVDDRPVAREDHPGMRVLRTGEAESGVELVVRRPERAGAILSVNSAPLRDPGGALAGAVTSLHDITGRKRAEEAVAAQARKLAKSNEELEKFAYVASHDLQEPLRTVASYLQLLQARYQGKLDAQADKFIGFAVDGAKRMKRLINDLLAYSRITRRSHTVEPTDCEAVFQQSLANLQASLQEGNVLVTHDSLPTVMADGVQLAQLFQNLVGNALKFHGPESPRVHISSERKGGDWVFSVRDNGIGIDPQYWQKIFEVFQRLHGKAEYDGTGIGLALCKHIVEQHGGRIWVESAPGQGSTFYFSLPERCEV